jgi:hypothetical protein
MIGESHEQRESHDRRSRTGRAVPVRAGAMGRIREPHVMNGHRAGVQVFQGERRRRLPHQQLSPNDREPLAQLKGFALYVRIHRTKRNAVRVMRWRVGRRAQELVLAQIRKSGPPVGVTS